MQSHPVRSTLHRVLGFALLMSVPACTSDSAPTAPAPRPLLNALPAAEQLPLETRLFLEDVQSRRDSVREVFATARAELAMNADALFGRRGLRTPATVCSGIAKELNHVLPKAEAAARDLWRPGRRASLMRAILQANDCPVPAAAHPSAGPQAVNASLSTTAVSESEFEAYLAENLRPEYWNAATAYGNAAPTDPGAFTAGMTEFERALFAEFVCETDAQYVAYGSSDGGGGSGSDPAPAMYSMFTTARGGCGGSAAAGCGAVVAAMWRETFAAAVWGGSRCGAWCAIGAAAGSAAVDCAAGAYGGYMVCQAAK